MYLESRYVQTLPRKPDALSGRVIAENIHGAVVYCTSGEIALLHGLFMAMFPIAIVGFFLDRRQRHIAAQKSDKSSG
jgi:hypothetical protein